MGHAFREVVTLTNNDIELILVSCSPLAWLAYRVQGMLPLPDLRRIRSRVARVAWSGIRIRNVARVHGRDYLRRIRTKPSIIHILVIGNLFDVDLDNLGDGIRFAEKLSTAYAVLVWSTKSDLPVIHKTKPL